MARKPHTVKEKKHLNSVASLGCIACAKLGIWDTPAEIHHIRHHTGMGRRASHFETMPLCPLHHRLGDNAYHNEPAWFNHTFGTQDKLLQDTYLWLGVNGCSCGCTKTRGADQLGLPPFLSGEIYE